MVHPEGAFAAGLNVTPLAPPHCEFWMMLPSALQECVSVQVLPSGMLYSQSMSVSWEAETWYVSTDMLSPSEQDIEGWSSSAPEMHLSWKARLVRTSLLPAESVHVKPENELLP